MNLSDVQDLVERAKHRGMNPIERLDAMGLVLTDDRRNQLVREVCELLAERIEQESLKNLMGERAHRNIISMSDVKYGIVEYIRRYFSQDSVE